jgi:hypothetical protein
MQTSAELCTPIPNARALLDHQEGRYVTVLQALINGRWEPITILSSTASSDRDEATRLGRIEADEFGVAWFDGARLPHCCRCCGEETETGEDCCTDDFPEPADVREWS